MARIPRGLLTVTALLGLAALAAPGAAAASDASDASAQDHPTAYNTKEQFLTADPERGMDTSCVERRISLGSGDYVWGIIGAGERTLYLGSGTYTWKDCLIPDDGFYVQQSTLNPDNPDWDTAILTDTWSMYGDQIAEWGSFLDPQF
ncbi:hypothetical protein [Streptomyces hoynatensis]|uniref:SH3 domain-containing protein n=1 Tax=Streptomyces hoynatensis TaxID=1141874 RepID=A0A3A9ZD60_9ACTN|nr:hypothetical protein [Streptomyces hoynatensis]RKN45744.1 hypothetical protein D7294_04600 [Streptomyces hoynatensis]